MASISSFSGIASGIQWRDLVDQIIAAESMRRLGPIQSRVKAESAGLDAWKSYQTTVSKLADAARKLQDSAFNGIKVTGGVSSVTSRTLFTTTASSAAVAGSYEVEVLSLARAEKVAGTARESTTEALGLSGDFLINGRRIEVAETDSLAAIRDKINAANSGAGATRVTATIISADAASHTLVLTSESAGLSGIDLTDGETGVLRSLGVVKGGTSANVTADGDARTHRFTTATAAVAAALGVTLPPPTMLKLGDKVIEVDLAVDSLASIAAKIQAAGGSAQVTEEVVGGTTYSRLVVADDVSAADPLDVDAQRTLELLGFQTAETNTLVAGSDAQVRIDGILVTRNSNVIADALPGVSLNLQQAEVGATSKLVVSRDVDGIVKAVNDFAQAYNDVLAFVQKETGASGALPYNGALRSSLSTFTGVMLSDVDGLVDDSPFTRAGLVGLELTKAGTLALDASKLRAALDSNFDDVRRLLGGERTSGAGTDVLGMAGMMLRATDAVTRTGDGLAALQVDARQMTIDNLDRRADDIQRQLDLRYDALIDQFVKMESALSRLQSQQAWMMSQLAALPTWNSKQS
jgi:flagellar hook-associated protein 2